MTAQDFSTEYCLNWIDQITRCQDYPALTLTFLGLLTDLPWIDAATAFEVYGNDQQSAKDMLIRKLPLDIGADADYGGYPLLSNRPLPERIEIVATETGTHALLPVMTDIGPHRVIVLDGRFDDDALALLANLLAIYRNLVILHDRKERDVLTRLPNRQSFETRLMDVCQYYRQLPAGGNGDEKLSWLAMLDIDHFKAVNDNFGHLYGDEVLLRFSQLMERGFRYIDFMFRFGGEEFVIILNRVSKIEALATLNRFRKQVEAFDFPLVGRVTVSIGATCIQNHLALPVVLLDRADQALYYAKDQGRNQVVLYEDIEGQQTTVENLSEIELF